MKYSNPSVREHGDGRWQVRFRYKDGDKWKTLSRNVEATSRRDATLSCALAAAEGLRTRATKTRSDAPSTRRV